MGHSKHSKAMIKLNISYLSYLLQSEFWGLKPDETAAADVDDIEQYIRGDRLFESDYFMEDVLPKIKHAGIEWIEVHPEQITDAVIKIHTMIVRAAKELGKDCYFIVDNFFETQTHVPKKDMYILVQLREIIEKRLNNMPVNRPLKAQENTAEAEV